MPQYGEIKEQVLHELEMTTELDDERVGRVIDEVLLRSSAQNFIPVRDKLRLRRELFHEIRGMDVLSELMEDREITEIMINGTAPIYVEKNGRIQKTKLSFSDEDRLLSVIGQIVSRANRSVNATNPIVDAVLPDGSRINVVLSGISRDGPAVTIRKFPEYAYSMEDLIRLGSLDEGTAEFLKLLVRAGYNLFISG
ncbi:MAG: CpaF family protein, partial [Eubacterium sp.]|nr:CpaF family protein [Eubacterium sp.]